MNIQELDSTVARLESFVGGVRHAFAHYYGSPSITVVVYKEDLASMLKWTLKGHYRLATSEELSARLEAFGGWITDFLAGGGGAMYGEFERAQRDHAALLRALGAERATFERDLSQLARASCHGAVHTDGSAGGIAEIAQRCVVLGVSFNVHLDG